MPRTAGTRTRTRTQAAAAPATEIRATVEDVPDAGHNGASAVWDIATAPITAVRNVADDVASTARRPDAVLYWGGLAGLAALGVLEWPAALAVGSASRSPAASAGPVSKPRAKTPTRRRQTRHDRAGAAFALSNRDALGG